MQADGIDALLSLLGPTSPASPALAAISTIAPTATLPYGPAVHATSAVPATATSTPAPTPPASPLLSGESFLTWLRDSIQNHRLVINDAKALVHTVADTVYLMSPGVFQRYAQEHPHVAQLAKQVKQSDWEWVQKRFEQLRLHRKQDNGLNIWTCEVTGPRKSRRVHGYLLADPSHIFAEIPFNNPYLKLLDLHPAD
jgi:hypothetical protein